MPTLPEIYTKIEDGYLLLLDKSVVKLMGAFYISNRLPISDAPWLFITAGSSTGKTELLKLLEKTEGYTPLDDISNNALLSGMRRHDESASLLHRMEAGGYIVFSDFTTMLSKHKEELSAILGKLRTVFDGKTSRATGGTEGTIKWEGKIGMLAACTTTLYSKTADYAEVGQRMIIYHLETADDYAIGRFKFKYRKKDKKKLLSEIQDMFKEYLEAIQIPAAYEDLPDFDEQTEKDILDIAHLAVCARSPLNRNKFARGNPFLGREDKEGIGRVQGQLMLLSYGLMLQNPDKKLTDEDRKLLYKIGLDCIDPTKREILRALTSYAYGGDVDSISEKIEMNKDLALTTVEDLWHLRMLEKQRVHMGHGSKQTYKLKDNFRAIMARFEGIEIKNEALPEATADLPLLPPEETPPPVPAPVQDDIFTIS